jgi:hypothetical protein
VTTVAEEETNIDYTDEQQDKADNTDSTTLEVVGDDNLGLSDSVGDDVDIDLTSLQ